MLKESLLMKAAMQYAPKRWNAEAAVGDGHRRKYKQIRPDHYVVVVAQCLCCASSEQVVYNNIWDEYANRFRLQLVDVLSQDAPSLTHVVRIKVCEHCIPLIEQVSLNLAK